MRYQQFFSTLDDLPGVLLFCGTEEFVKDAGLAALKNAVLKGGVPDLNETYVDGAIEFARLKELCETMPFMGEKRLVVLRDSPFFTASAPKDAVDNLLDYVKNVPEYTQLLFFERGAVDKTRRLAKYLYACDWAVEFTELSQSELVAWITKRVSAAGKTITPVAVNTLILMAGTLLSALSCEVDKLVAYCHSQDAIIDRDVEAVVTATTEYSIFKVTDNLIAGKTKEAAGILRALGDRGEDIQRMASGMTTTFRRLFEAKALAAGGHSSADVAARLGIKPGWAQRLLASVRAISQDRLSRALRLSTQIELRIRKDQIEPELALYTAIFNVRDALYGP